MPDAKTHLRDLVTFDALSSGNTSIHRLHPLAKVVSALTIIIFTASFGRYDCFRLAPYLLYPFAMMALAEVPYRLMLSRVLVALPFCLFAGLSNAMLDTAEAYAVGGVPVSYGLLSLATILLKMYICVMAALLLVATTPLSEIAGQLRRFRVPSPLVIIFEMTYRYIGVLLAELYSMTTAYQLRSGLKKKIEMKHMGAFAGQLLLRGFGRAERVYAAMSCRGYPQTHVPPAFRGLRIADIAALCSVCIPAALLRFIIIS